MWLSMDVFYQELIISNDFNHFFLRKISKARIMFSLLFDISKHGHLCLSESFLCFSPNKNQELVDNYDLNQTYRMIGHQHQSSFSDPHQSDFFQPLFSSEFWNFYYKYILICAVIALSQLWLVVTFFTALLK